MKIIVKQEHIDKGTRLNSSSCALALAINEATGKQLQVSMRRYWVDYDLVTTRYWPEEIKDKIAAFVYNFDQNNKVEPFEFELNIY